MDNSLQFYEYMIKRSPFSFLFAKCETVRVRVRVRVRLG